MLLKMKSYTEAVRALILYTSYSIDQERIAKTDEESIKWERRTAFLTPVAKAYCTDLSFRVTEEAMQVYGGYGYMKDYPVEQFLRDEKVHSLFEGTNGIQALDLAGRKLLRDHEDLVNGLFKDISEFCDNNISHKTLAPYIEELDKALNALKETSLFLSETAKKDFKILALYATQYMELFGDVTSGWLLLWQAAIAQDKLNGLAEAKGIKDAKELENFITENSEAAFYSGKLASARYFVSNVVGQAKAKADVIKRADKAALDIAEESF
jgi:hypothetical protein